MKPWLWLVVALVAAAPAWAATPQLQQVLPRGGQRGTDVELTFTGARLADAKDVMFYSKGFTATEFKVVNDKQVKVKVRIDAKADLGEHAMRLRTATGISELRTFWVGALPCVAEKEPNTEFGQPQAIAMNVTVEGIITNEDVDHFVVEAKKGQRLTAEIEGIRLGGAMFDPYVAILDENRFELAASDDTALLKQDAFASVIAPKDGKYIVQVRESAFGGSADSHYRLHVGTFPRPHTIYPCGGPAGETLAVQFLGDVRGTIAQALKLPATPAEFEVPFFAEQEGQVAPSPNYVRVSAFPNVMEAEPNDTLKDATTAKIDPPFAFNGIFADASDIDFFRFRGKKGQALDVNVYARRVRSPLDPVLNILDGAGKSIANNDDSGGPDSYLRFVPPNDGEFVLRVRDHLRGGGPTYVYRIEVTPVRPALTVAIPAPSQLQNNSQERQTVAVPRGNRYATLIRATRANLGGELVLESKDLPPGMKMTALPFANGSDVTPVVFEAAADAPVGGKLCAVTVRATDPKAAVAGHWLQNVDLIVGNPNNTAYHRVRVNEMAAAVTEEAPFSIEVVPPKAPIVQSGSGSIRVTAKRKEGFKEPISLRLLNPPTGVSGASTVNLPAGQDAIDYPLNASESAGAKKWPIVVLASANVNGPLWVSSQIVELEVATPFLAGKIVKGSVEQGHTAQVVCNLDQKTPFEGKAKIELVGLPANTTAEPREIASGDAKVIFDVHTTPKSPPGPHASLFCRVIVMKDGQPIVHNIARGGALRIDAVAKSPATRPARVAQADARPKP